MMPFSSRSGHFTPFSDALFTSTSAVCVTGLVVHDTATYWSIFGQIIILALIQIGGMGVVTIAVAIARLSGRKIGFFQRNLMQESISAHQVGGIVKLTNFIVTVTLAIELLGATVMAPEFCSKYGILKGIWYSVFHSISAFCNAGFDLMGVEGEYSSLTPFVGSPLINITVMLLIIIGGIGFLTWNDVKVHKLKFKKYRMQSKVALSVSAFLILLPALFLFFVEFSKGDFSNMTLGERILASLFHSTATRTAGFNTIDMSSLSGPGQLITIVLMLIGGSPGSTAGGLKTTTVMVLLASSISVFNKKSNAHCFGRTISVDIIKTAGTILMMYLVLFLSGSVIICCVEGLPMNEVLFETASAIGTVGLSMGITPGLGLISRIVLIGLMYFGRVGSLTFIFAAISKTQSSISRYPQEKITVG
ncbi:MAG: TrkH family potassium uptake protein [Ruminococcus sp.]